MSPTKATSPESHSSLTPQLITLTQHVNGPHDGRRCRRRGEGRSPGAAGKGRGRAGEGGLGEALWAPAHPAHRQAPPLPPGLIPTKVEGGETGRWARPGSCGRAPATKATATSTSPPRPDAPPGRPPEPRVPAAQGARGAPTPPFREPGRADTSGLGAAGSARPGRRRCHIHSLCASGLPPRPRPPGP